MEVATLVGYYTSNCFGWNVTSTTNFAAARASDYIRDTSSCHDAFVILLYIIHVTYHN